MIRSRARNSAASQDTLSRPEGRRRKLLNKRRGVSPQAVICSALLCGGAFAYALSVSSDGDTLKMAQAASPASVQEAVVPVAATAEIAASPAAATATLRAARLAQATPAEEADRLRPIHGTDPRWASDVQPVKDGFDWKGRLGLSDDGSEIVTLDRPANPLIRKDAPSELAYAEPARKPASQQAAGSAEFNEAELVNARTTSAVNMRASGKKNATVITVLPGGAEILVAEGCQHWCPTIFEDKRGYVYKSYISLVDMETTASIRATAEEGSEAEPATEKARTVPQFDPQRLR